MSSSSSLDSLRSYFRANEAAIVDDFFHFLRFPSISADPEYRPQLLACGDWLRQYLVDIGLTVETWETSGPPVLFASHMEAGPDKPTLLIYNHYDVQPVDPLEEWDSAPFEPTVRDGQVYARGAQDNKGQCYYTLQAVKALLQRDGKLPLNLKWIIEGEEEVGSENLPEVLAAKKEELEADYVLIVDVGLRAPDQPAVTLGVRGMVTMDFEVESTVTDLHSGSHGGLAYNPNRAIVEMLSKLRDASGKVIVPGFYDDVVEIPQEELKTLDFDFDPEHYEKTFGAKPTGGEPGFTEIESNLLRPTLEINGVHGGYGGPGFKTVIPAKAFAKISCRIVPDQDPAVIGQRIKDYLESIAPEGIRAKVTVLPGNGKASRAPATSALAQGVAQAYSEVCGKPCRFILEGASIPITPDLEAASGGDVVLMGYGLGTDQIHAPNEHFGLDRIEKGFLTVSRAIELLGAV